MTKCPKCGGFTERVNFASPGEYLDTVRQLVEVVNQGSFLLVFASCPLQDMFNYRTCSTLLSQETASFTIFNAPRAGLDSNSSPILFTAWRIGHLETNSRPIETLPGALATTVADSDFSELRIPLHSIRIAG
jgi:hypothetical protein